MDADVGSAWIRLLLSSVMYIDREEEDLSGFRRSSRVPTNLAYTNEHRVGSPPAITSFVGGNDYLFDILKLPVTAPLQAQIVTVTF